MRILCGGWWVVGGWRVWRCAQLGGGSDSKQASAGAGSARVVAVTDVLDRSLQCLPLVSDAAALGVSGTARTPVLDAALLKAAQTAFGAALTAAPYLQFVGPTLPTNAEVNIARLTVCCVARLSCATHHHPLCSPHPLLITSSDSLMRCAVSRNVERWV